ncbi:hypothetical protein Tco_0636833 [Tanacetum coccineum]
MALAVAPALVQVADRCQVASGTRIRIFKKRNKKKAKNNKSKHGMERTKSKSYFVVPAASSSFVVPAARHL